MDKFIFRRCPFRRCPFRTIWVGLGGGALLGCALGGLLFSAGIPGAIVGAILGLTNSILILRKEVTTVNPEEHFFSEVYPKIWHKAYDVGKKARKEGVPRDACNLSEDFSTPSGHLLKCYKSAWEQGWDGYTIPEIFGIMEKALDKLPTEKI